MTAKNNQALLLVADALKLDGNGHSKEAYFKYLQSIGCLNEELLGSFNLAGIPKEEVNCQKTLKTIFLIKQCLERLEVLVKPQDPVNSDEVDGMNLFYYKGHPKKEPKKVVPNESTDGVPLNTFNHMSIGPPVIPRAPSPVPKETPLERAYKENARLQKAFGGRINAAKDYRTRVNLHLQMERRIAENLSVARLKQAELEKEKQRKERLMLETALKKLTPWGDVTDKNTKKKQILFAKILSFEDTQAWPNGIRQSLLCNPGDYTLAKDAVEKTLLNFEHPLAQWLQTQQHNLQDQLIRVLNSHVMSINKHSTYLKSLGSLVDLQDLTSEDQVDSEHSTSLESSDESCTSEDSLAGIVKRKNFYAMQSDALQRHLDNIISDLGVIRETLFQILLLLYEPLQLDDAQDICFITMEDILLKPLWPALAAVVSLSDSEMVHNVKIAMEQLRELSPEAFGISETLFDDQTVSFTEEIISEIQKLISILSPMTKLQAFVRITQRICKYLTEEGPNHVPGRVMGADELVPVLSYLLVRSNLPQLVVECHALELLVDHQYLKGEEGYCLTSFQTALKYIEMNWK